MNHLHELLEAMNNSAQLWTQRYIKPVDIDLCRIISGLGSRAICFHMGECEPLESLAVIPELVRLPYPTTYFEVDVTTVPDEKHPYSLHIVTGILAHELDSTITGVVLSRIARQWIGKGVFKFYRDSGLASCTPTAEQSPGSHEWVMGSFGVVARFLSALHCTNVERRETAPPEKLQAARARRGKLPLFSTWTLNLELPRTPRQRVDLGSTHASPRVHLRRGHPRQFAPGKWTWVQPHVVGNGPGIVHKDYAAKFESDSPHPARTP